MEEKAVANTSSILFLAKINRFDLLKNKFSKILIPKQVIEEIFEKDNPENLIIKKELESFLKETEIKEIKDFRIDKGEQAALSLCMEKKISIFISDDKKARKFARSIGIETIGIAGILLWNLENKKIGKEELNNLLEELIKKDYYISSSIYAKLKEESK